jgi:methionine-rich copper-binding protein CopC
MTRGETKLKRLLITAALALLPLAAGAHELAKGPNGGPVVDSGGHHLEMVSTGAELTIFLSEEDNSPIQSAGSKNARAVVQDGGKTATIPLRPAAPNKLVGTLAQPLGAGARVVVSATMPDGHAVQGRFVKN